MEISKTPAKIKMKALIMNHSAISLQSVITLKWLSIRNLAFKNKEPYLSMAGWIFDLNTINLGLEFEKNDELNGKIEVNEISLQDQYFSFVERGKLSTNFLVISKSDIVLSNTKVTSNRMNFDGLVSLKIFSSQRIKLSLCRSAMVIYQFLVTF